MYFAMKTLKLRKHLLSIFVGFSLFSFIFVNGHAYFTLHRPLLGTHLTAAKVVKSENQDAKDQSIPFVAALEKVVNLIQHFVPASH